MQDDERNERLRQLGHGRILPLLWRFAWPALVTMTLNMLYNVIDRIYIGNLPDLAAPGAAPGAAPLETGADAIAGLALTFPIMTVMAAFGPLIGVGSGALISIKLGEKDMTGAERTLGQCVALKLLLGVTVAPVLFLLLRPLLGLMAGGLTPAAVDCGLRYLRIVVLFHFLAHLAFGLSACMRSEGSPISSMRCMMAGAFANLVLDPIFIFDRIPLGFVTLPGLGMRVAGAAWATNVAMALAAFAALRHYTGGHAVVRLRLRNVRVFPDLAPRVLAIGLSPFLMQFVGSTINFSLNRAFGDWSATPADATAQVAAFGIFHTVAMLFFMPAMGVQQGFAPIIGYNWGARNLARVRRSLDTSIALTTAVVVLACATQLLLAHPLAWCFSASKPAVTAAGTFAIRIGNCMIWCIGLNIAATTYFQSVGRPRAAILLSLLRQFLILLPCVWILPHVLPVRPVLAIWLSLPISDVLAFLATIPPILRERRALARTNSF